MSRPLLLAFGSTLAALSLGSAPAAAAPAKAAAATAADPSIPQPGWSPPRNAFGQPDFSGYWANATITPLTRNPRLTDKAVMSAAEAHSVEKVWTDALEAADQPTTPNATASPLSQKEVAKLLELRPEFAAAGGDTGGYNAFWIDPGTHIMEVNGEYRTSLVTTPNGQPPPRKDGQPVRYFGGGGRSSYDSYETRSLGERCIMGFGRNAGPPMLPNGFYNNDYYILQTPDTVVIQIEMIHDLRVVRLNATHRTDGVRPWMGDSIGHYEGNTLVVETTNIPQREAFFGAWKNTKITERFTRVSPTRINYQFQVDDPDLWAKPWGGEYDFYPLKGIIYEYACHEGNYALPSILAGARHMEKEAAAQAAAPKPAAPVPPAAAAKPSKGG